MTSICRHDGHNDNDAPDDARPAPAPHALDALLGETPLLVERRSSPGSPAFNSGHARSASTISTESKRSGRLFLAAHAPRSSSFALFAAPPVPTNHDHARLTPVARPTLFLRVPPAASAFVSSPAERTPLPSPLSPTFNLNSPAPAADACRRKMAKLVRTLGENVPPELVFTAARVRRRASTLTSSVPEFVLERRRTAAVAAEEKTAPRPSFNADEPFSFPFTVPFAPSLSACVV
ncbi:hypothetical protein B0H17DRAFT_407139 [Mycena rosella]|uniref:Uncharacterized protein n=1 Tax=Mycena rosella TaxID=1033263 RepID=A0AAD7DQZ9_MYCRO|nr:hypothetical protein B0H17DRAFT_407139 [Mycena rosella]